MCEPTKALYGGGISSFVGLAICVPFEVLKCRAQMNKSGSISYSKEIRSILKLSGPIGLYRGFWAVAIRDVPGIAVMFGVWEKCKQIN